jgi:hypothetical protein
MHEIQPIYKPDGQPSGGEIVRPVYNVTIPPLSDWESLEPYADGRFSDVDWHDFSPEPHGLEINIDGRRIRVTTFGLQRTNGPDSRVQDHFEPEMEIVYPLAGDGATMAIHDGSPESIHSHTLNGPFGNEEDLVGRNIAVFVDGSVTVDNLPLTPTVTHAGQHHGTEGGPLTYLVIKGIPQDN